MVRFRLFRLPIFKCFLIALPLFFSQLSISQLPSLRDTLNFVHLSGSLPQNSATTLHEDAEGFIWVGTSNGLYKFNGKNYDYYSGSQDGKAGLQGNYVNKIFENNDSLYILTHQGLNIYDRDLDLMSPYPFKNQGLSIASKNIQSIERTKNHLWLGTNHDGLYRYDIKFGLLKQFLIDEHRTVGMNRNHILGVQELSTNRFAVISNSAIFLIDDNLKVIAEIEEKNITSFQQIKENEFFVGTGSGTITQIVFKDKTIIKESRREIAKGHAIFALTEDKMGRLWIGTENNGLFIYSKDKKVLHHLKHDKKRPKGISHNTILSLLTAKDGVVWLGTYKNGLSFYDPLYKKFEHIQADPFDDNSLNHNMVNCFLEDKHGNLWIGTDGGGLNYWDRSKNKFTHYSLDKRNFGSNVVLSLLQIDENTIWAGTWGKGIIVFDIKSKTYTTMNTKNSFLTSDHAFSIYKDKKERIWILNFFGSILVYDPKTKTHEALTLDSEADGATITTFASILEDNNGNFWLTSQTSGLFRLYKDENQWVKKHYHSEHSERPINHDATTTIVQDTNDNIWLATQEGLSKYNSKTDCFVLATHDNRIRRESIKAIIPEDNTILWLSTAKGLIKFNTESEEILTYDKADGLQPREFNENVMYKTEKGELLFGGSEGFNIFTPDDAQKRVNKPPIYISDLKISNESVLPNDKFKVLNKAISQTDSITLSYQHDVVNFEFQTITFRHAERVNYAYFLEGFETDWNYVGNTNKATYTNLSPGDYKLRIRSSNSDGIWNDDEVTLTITITPPFWETNWFRFLVIVTLIRLIYSFYEIRIRRIKKHQEELELKIEQRTSELELQRNKLSKVADELSSKNEEIQRFAFAVSHDLKSPLSSIKGIANLIPLEIVIKDFPDLENYLDMINISCDTMTDLIEDITKIAKVGKIENKYELLNTDEIMELSRYLVSGKLNLDNVRLNIQKNLPEIYGDRNRMIQVFGNLIDNAIKYMGNQESPTIDITAEGEGEFFHFSVTDNGSGMDKKSLKKIFSPFERFHANVKGAGLGLYMIKQIVESHHGDISVDSPGKGMGCTFTVKLLKSEIAIKKEEAIKDKMLHSINS